MFGKKIKIDPNSEIEIQKRRNNALAIIETVFALPKKSIILTLKNNNLVDKLIDKLKEEPTKDNLSSILIRLGIEETDENLEKAKEAGLQI